MDNHKLFELCKLTVRSRPGTPRDSTGLDHARGSKARGAVVLSPLRWSGVISCPPPLFLPSPLPPHCWPWLPPAYTSRSWKDDAGKTTPKRLRWKVDAGKMTPERRRQKVDAGNAMHLTPERRRATRKDPVTPSPVHPVAPVSLCRSSSSGAGCIAG
jgi:hypothetical protein